MVKTTKSIKKAECLKYIKSFGEGVLYNCFVFQQQVEGFR